MNRTIRIIKLIFLALALLLCLAVPVMGLLSTAFYWEGTCHGFTDGAWECSWWEFAQKEIFWASMIFIPFIFLVSLAWLGMALVQFIAHQWEKRRNSA